MRTGEVDNSASLRQQGFRGERFDAVVSCMASRSGAPRDDWEVDHAAHLPLLVAAKEAGVPQMVVLSAICRPTAFFNSLAGQVARVQKGKPFMVFGDGTVTACKPISDADLGAFIASCLDDPARQNRVLPIGGPGPALTPRGQKELRFRLAERTPRFKQVPSACST